MPKFQPSKYYADDKDVHDILSSPKIPLKKLLSLCRQRGIFLSEECPREELVHYMSKLPFSWLQIQEVMGEVEREDREENLTTCKLNSNGHLDAVEQAIQKVRENRGEALSEVYDVTQTKEGRLQIKVVYTEPDFQRARLIQRRQKEAIIEIEAKGKDLDVRHTQNEKTQDILAELQSLLTPPDGADKPVLRTIELSGIRNHKQRTKFFINLFSGMEGFQLREVRDLKVDLLTGEEANDPAQPEEDQELRMSKEALKALVRKVALSGENILLSPQYQQLAKDGFFISKAIWTSMETAAKGRLFEFEAEFQNPQSASDFAYRVRGMYDRDKDGELVKAKTHVDDSEKDQLRSCLEAAAYASIENVIGSKQSI
jgi:hypothetical protein